MDYMFLMLNPMELFHMVSPSFARPSWVGFSLKVRLPAMRGARAGLESVEGLFKSLECQGRCMMQIFS